MPSKNWLRHCKTVIKRTAGFVAFLAASATLLTYLGYQLHHNPVGAPTSDTGHPPLASGTAPGGGKRQPQNGRPIYQSSTGAQSPSLNDIKGQLKIQYDAPARTTPQSLPKQRNTIRSASAPTSVAQSAPRSVTQMSAGDQSPNVNNVSSGVDIRYGGPAQNPAETKPEGTQ